MQRFDLGHLEILEVLLEEESVSRAALRLHVSPSALSRTLAKMREVLGDELLAPTGRELTLTQRGTDLQKEIKKLNDQARLLLGKQKEANPIEIRRVFRIRASDYSTIIIGTHLMKEVRRIAPGATIAFMTQAKEDIESFRRGAVDFDIGVPPEAHPEIFREHLLNDHFVCAFSKDAPIARKKISLSEFVTRPHIITSRKSKTFVIIDEILERLGKRRRVLATVSSFQEALVMASQGDALVQIPSRLADMMQKPLRLQLSPLPLKTPPIDIALSWHSRNKNDYEHQWLRNLIFQTLQQKKS